MRRPATSNLTVLVGLVVMAVLAVGGSATAAALITSKQIKNNTIKSVDIRNNALTGADLRDGSVGGADVADGSLSAGDLSGAARTALAGPVASGRVSSSGSLTASHGPVTVVKGAIGWYCLSVAGATPATHVVVVTPNYSNDSTNPDTDITAGAEAVVDSPCAAGEFGVTTFLRNGTGAVDVANQGFTFVVN